MKGPIKSGFTLVELLVSLSILALISMMMAYSLQRALKTVQGVKVHTDVWQDLQRTYKQLSIDIYQCVQYLPLSSQVDVPKDWGLGMLSFVSAGLRSPFVFTESPRTTDIIYTLKEGMLYRYTQGLGTVMLKDVQQATFYYYDTHGQVHTTWPYQDERLLGLKLSVDVGHTQVEWLWDL